jgi:protease I
MGKLDGKRIAILATDGVEQVELTKPREALEAEGATTELVSLEAGEIQGFEHLDHADKLPVDKTVKDVSADDYDGVLIPGGVANGDFLRADQDACAFVAAFAEQKKPIASICHGPWILVETGIVKGRTITSWPSLKTDVENAGGTWVDEEVHVDGGLTTSRKPDDLPAFNAKMIEEFCEGPHDDAPQPEGRFAREEAEQQA